jgi:hypothetical protein
LDLSCAFSCGGGTEEIEWAIGGSTTVTQTTTIGAEAGIDIEGVSIGLSASVSDSKAVTASQTVTVKIPPGKTAVQAAGINYHVYSSNVQVNYADKQYGHYEVRFGIVYACGGISDRLKLAVVHGCGGDERNPRQRGYLV